MKRTGTATMAVAVTGLVALSRAMERTKGSALAIRSEGSRQYDTQYRHTKQRFKRCRPAVDGDGLGCYRA